MKLSYFAKFFLMILLGLNFIACGNDYPVDHHKNFNLYVENENPYHIEIFSHLVNQYNSDLGFKALNLVQDRSQANSLIVMTKGLQRRDNKLGWGQWMTETIDDSSVLTLHTVPEKRDVFYSMRVEFDLDYVEDRYESDSYRHQYEIKKLWSHEVGHGFQMGHSPYKHNVMYESIEGEKDFDLYFNQVRQFFGEPVR